jgi:hypothetical protein
MEFACRRNSQSCDPARTTAVIERLGIAGLTLQSCWVQRVNFMKMQEEQSIILITSAHFNGFQFGLVYASSKSVPLLQPQQSEPHLVTLK